MTTTNSKIRPRPLAGLLRPNIISLLPYSSGRTGIQDENTILLDANENPEGLYNRYPDNEQAALKMRISAIRQLPPEQIFIGNGSDEIIDLCFRAFCRPGIDKAITYAPTFSMYRFAATVNDVGFTELPLDDQFQANPDLLEPFAADDTAKLLLLCSPNNPTGNSLHQLEELVTGFPGIILIDEAYIDFSQQPGFLLRLSACPNVIICQTMSKSRGLAGARIGMAFASAAIIRVLNAVCMPYNVSTLNQRAALQALDAEDTLQQRLSLLLAERTRVARALSRNALIQTIYPSDANFLLVRVSDAPWLCSVLRAKGILVKDQSAVITGGIRISIGSEQENNTLIRELNKLSNQS